MALRWQIVDVPNEPRKIHARPVALLGGLAPFFVFVLGVLAAVNFGLISDLRFKHLIGLIVFL